MACPLQNGKLGPAVALFGVHHANACCCQTICPQSAWKSYCASIILLWSTFRNHRSRGVGMLGISKLQNVLVTLLAWSACNAFGQQTQNAGNHEVVSFLAPGRASQAGALQQLSGQNQPAVGRARQATSPEERGQPSWGSYSTPTDEEGTSDGPTRVRILLLMCLLFLLRRFCIQLLQDTLPLLGWPWLSNYTVSHAPLYCNE